MGWNITLGSAGVGMVIGFIGAIAYVSGSTGEQLEVPGGKIGWTTKYAKLSETHEVQRKVLEAVKTKLDQANDAVRTLAARNQKLEQEQKQRELQAASEWRPVDEIYFTPNGEFSSRKKQGSGLWADEESEVKLKLAWMKSGEVAFNTNLRAPYNRIDFTNKKPTFDWCGLKFEYLFTADDLYRDSVSIKVQRREKVAC